MKQGAASLEQTDWLFDALFELAEAADEAGFARLAQKLEAAMDVFEDEEHQIYGNPRVFHTQRPFPGGLDRSQMRKDARSWVYAKDQVAIRQGHTSIADVAIFAATLNLDAQDVTPKSIDTGMPQRAA